MTALGSWGCAAGILGWAIQGPPLKSKGKVARILNALQGMAFPVYVLHQVVLVAVAEYFVLHLPLGPHGQLVLLILIGFTLSVALYALMSAVPVLPHVAFGWSYPSYRKQGKALNRP